MDLIPEITASTILMAMQPNRNRCNVGNLAIAATAHERRPKSSAAWAARRQNPVFDVHLVPDSSLQRDPLFAYIKTRCVQRRPFSRRPLSLREKAALENECR